MAAHPNWVPPDRRYVRALRVVVVLLGMGVSVLLLTEDNRRSSDDSWDPPFSEFRPIGEFGVAIGLLAASTIVLALYNPDVEIASSGLIISLVILLLVLLGDVDLRFAVALPAALGVLALQYLRALPDPVPGWLAGLGAFALMLLPLIVWKYTLITAFRNILAVQIVGLVLLMTSARLATAAR